MFLVKCSVSVHGNVGTCTAVQGDGDYKVNGYVFKMHNNDIDYVPGSLFIFFQFSFGDSKGISV